MSYYRLGTPALEHIESAKLMAESTLPSLKFSATHLATELPLFDTTQRQSIYHYGHDMQPVSSSTYGLAHSGRLL